MWIQRFAGWKAWAVVLLIYFTFQLFRATLLAMFPAIVQSLVVAAAVGFAILTWIAPAIFRHMVGRELKKVSLRPDF
jgi:hypothetical protein